MSFKEKTALLRKIPHDESESIKGVGMGKWSLTVELRALEVAPTPTLCFQDRELPGTAQHALHY